jgi:hypothetical protein
MKMLSFRVTDDLDAAIREAAVRAGSRNLTAFLQTLLARAVSVADVKAAGLKPGGARLVRSSWRRSRIRG